MSKYTVYAVDITDNASLKIERLKTAAQQQGYRAAVGRSLANLQSAHFFKLEAERPNQGGFPRSHFWSAAGKGTHYQTTPDGADIVTSKLGVLQRRYGGTIKPKNGKRYLTIPACAEAYNHRAGEFSNLTYGRALYKDGSLRPALVEAQATQLKKKRGGGYNPGVALGGQVYFWLVRSVTQDPDPSVFPTRDEVRTAAVTGASAYMARYMKEGAA